ncbi:MAG TPA: ATP-binding protein [Candidatus Acidoferrales bacterium]|nr:ATP-binding protein [Candidatus Acidoferrales bacterium]
MTAALASEAVLSEPLGLEAGWLEANQRFLSAELRRIASHLGPDEPDGERAGRTSEVQAARWRLAEPAAVDWLAAAFGLSDFERDVLLLAAGVDLDSTLARRCLAVSGRDRATFGLALATLPGAHWSALLPDAPLRRWTLVRPAEGLPLVTAPLEVDEPVLHALTGLEALDPSLAPLLELATRAPVSTLRQMEQAEALAALVSASGSGVYELVGDDPDGQLDVAVRAASAAGLRTWRLRAADLPAEAHARESLAGRWNRDAILLRAALIVSIGDATELGGLDCIDRLKSPVFVLTGVPVPLRGLVARFRIDRPTPLEQRGVWRDVLDRPVDDDVVDTLASQLRLSTREIAEAAPRVSRAVDSGRRSDVFAAAQPATALGLLGSLATWIEPRASWADLVLPDEQISALRAIVAQVRGRTKVNELWGFRSTARDGGGIAVLFEGESGTGKSLAAEVLATELGLPLLRVDLASVVSKYIGETEKNIGRIFEAAEGSGAIILFDEAEALFGKRSDVRDSHDRYANIEIAYLLARTEAYRGLAILTSNAKASLDRAFQRRLRFVVRFPFPDQTLRARIWTATFPKDAPLRGVDVDRLARLAVAGGDIRNIATAAAFAAAAAGELITMRHLRGAAVRELEKLGRAPTDADTRGWQ